jgi:hypothetical protein
VGADRALAGQHADEQEGVGYKVHPLGTHIFEGVDIAE